MNHPPISPTGFPSGNNLSPDAPFPFACRGCGQRCCVDTNVLVSPPEAARIAWHLERAGLAQEWPPSRWGELFLGGSTGLPVLRLLFQARAGDPSRYCPFLAPGSADAGTCRVHAARPAACRLYPLGRLLDLAGRSERLHLLERCPGFERPQPGEPVPPGYTPAPHRQTARDWVRQAVQPEMDAEKRRYVEVIQAYVKLGLHAPTRDNPNGQLSERAALFLGPALFYRLPAAPANPADDHAALLAWLESLEAAAGPVRALLGRSDRGG